MAGKHKESAPVKEPKLIPLSEARRRWGVSKVTMARLVKEGQFTVYENPLDRRQKLVSEAEVEAVVRPRKAKPQPY